MVIDQGTAEHVRFLRVYDLWKEKENMFPEIRNGARAHQLPFFREQKKLMKPFQKNAKKIMRVPDHGPHHREKFRTEMSPYAPWGKMTKF